MDRQLILVIILLMLFAVNSEGKVRLAPDTTPDKSKRSVVAEEEQSAECLCPESMGRVKGEKPFLSLKSDEGELEVVLCGHVSEKVNSHIVIAAEFELVPCGLDRPLMQFDALENCRIEKKDGKLDITEFKRLPFGKNWEWIDVDYFHYGISLMEPDSIVIDRTLVFIPAVLTQSQIEEALKEYEEQKAHLGYNEEFPFMMLAAALNGSEETKSKFLKMREDLRLDGHMAEMHNEAMEVYRAYKERHIEEGKGVYAEDVGYHKEYSLEKLKELFE